MEFPRSHNVDRATHSIHDLRWMYSLSLFTVTLTIVDNALNIFQDTRSHDTSDFIMLQRGIIHYQSQQDPIPEDL